MQPSLPETLYTAPDLETTKKSGNETLHYAADVNVGRRHTLVKLRNNFSTKKRLFDIWILGIYRVPGNWSEETEVSLSSYNNSVLQV